MRCTGNSNLTSSAARHLHKEICAMLLEALESLKVALSEFTTVLPQQWVSLMGNGVTTNGEWCGPEQRLKKITEAAMVTLLYSGSQELFDITIPFFHCYPIPRSWRQRTSSPPEPTQILHNCAPSASSTGGRLCRRLDKPTFTRYSPRSTTFCVCDASPKDSSSRITRSMSSPMPMRAHSTHSTAVLQR